MEKITTRAELLIVLDLCQKFLSESRYKDVLLDKHKVSMILDFAQETPDRFFIKYNIDDEGYCVGLFIGHMEELFFSTLKQARDLVFYVDPSARGGKWFIRTFKEFEHWAKEHGANYIEILHNTGINTESAPPMFERLGYNKVGYIFNKEI